MPTEMPHSGALPVTAEQWRLYLAEYNDWYLSGLTEEDRQFFARDMPHEFSAQWFGREPATEQMIAATEERLGVRLPPSLRGFLLASNGWGPVSAYTSILSPCEEIDWFPNAEEDYMDGYQSVYEDEGEEMPEDDMYLHALSLAKGDDTILLDTRSASAEGEYDAFLLHLGGGHLSEPCKSFSEIIAHGRAQIEFVRSPRAE
jgi:hypothetical protein